MSATSEHATVVSRGNGPVDVKMEKKESSKNYKGFVAGVFSGIAKLSGEYTICLFSSPLLPKYRNAQLKWIILPSPLSII
jgi:hypothetical protein